ncbi:MAG: TIGR03086 family metal-binding protein [Acidimicrobiia bacterium]|nr:TIGR03086 family metal-binding protein [Acidimicrobiia bacterium]
MTTHQIPQTLPADPRPQFAAAFATAGKVIAGVKSDQMSRPTPCEEMDVAQLLGHLRMVANRVARLGRNDELFDHVTEPPPPADGDHRRWWSEAGEAITAAWTEERLTQPVVLPWMQGTGADALAGYVNEVTVHTWDLARATGQDVAWDDEAVAVGLAALQAVLPGSGRTAQFEAMRAQMPPEMADFTLPFAEPVEIGDGDAPLIDRSVAYNGRNPAWAPTG